MFPPLGDPDSSPHPSRVTVPAIQGIKAVALTKCPPPRLLRHPYPGLREHITQGRWEGRSADALTCEETQFPAARDCGLRKQAGAFMKGKTSTRVS